MKRTEKSKANSIGNGRQKSTANRQAEEQSQRQARANQRTTTETRRSTRRNTVQRKAAASQSRSIQEPDADVQQGQFELKLDEVIKTISKIDINEGTVEYKKIIQDSSKAETQKVQKTVKITQIRDPEHSDGFFQLESRGSMKSAQQAKAAATSRRSLPQPRRISNRTLRTFL